MTQSDPSAFLDITVHGIKSNKAFASKIFVEYIIINVFSMPYLPW